jgi:spermidine/putrescine transport system permease protein
VLAVPAALLLLLFLIAPLAVFVVYSFLTGRLFTVSGPLTIGNYTDALTSPLNRTLARNSLIIGVTTATVVVIVALPIAYWVRYAAGRWRLPVLLLLTTSMLASYLVRIYAWRTILGESGMLNRALQQLGLVDEPLGFLLYSRFAVVVALVHIYLPYVVLVLFAGLLPVSGALIEAGEDLGSSAVERWRRVLLPLVAAPAVTSFLFVFILAASDYVTPQFLGGPTGSMLGVQVQANFKGIGDWPAGAATAFLMLLAFMFCYAAAAGALRALRLDRIEWVN